MATKTQLAPYSRPLALSKVDGRTAEGQLLAATRAELIAHVGGSPSATQWALIEQAAQLRLRIAVMDRAFAKAGSLTDHDTRTYLAWANAYSRHLRAIGLKPTPPPAPSLHEIMGQHPAP